MSTPTDIKEVAVRLTAAFEKTDIRGAWDPQDVAEGFTSDDIPSLITIAESWAEEPEDDEWEYLPIAAWRTLAGLQATEAFEPLFDLLASNDDDDWIFEDFPIVFTQFGESILDTLVSRATDETYHRHVSSVCIDAIGKLGQTHADCFDRVVETLSKMLHRFNEQDVERNTYIVGALYHLRASSSAEVIERAFAANRVDFGYYGDWEEVRRHLQVPGLGLEMPKEPFNTLADFQKHARLENILDIQIFDEDGNQGDEQIEEYAATMMTSFNISEEGTRVRSCNGDIGWAWTFVELGINHLGADVTSMTAPDASEILFSLFPRKVSVDAGNANAIVYELEQFWMFVKRVLNRPNADAVLEVVQGSADRLQRELSDPRNFGMAKSFFTSGNAAGFDMTTPEGLAEFTVAYNASLSNNRIDSPHRDSLLPPPPKSTSTPDPPARALTASDKKARKKDRQRVLNKKLKNKRR